MDWFRTILEILRHAIFVGFYVLSLRMVFVTLTHEVMIIMLGGGDKSSQAADIAAAKALADTFEE